MKDWFLQKDWFYLRRPFYVETIRYKSYPSRCPPIPVFVYFGEIKEIPFLDMAKYINYFDDHFPLYATGLRAILILDEFLYHPLTGRHVRGFCGDIETQTMIIFKEAFEEKFDWFIYHELSHLPYNTAKIPEWWEGVREEEQKFISDYAKINAEEDFAETASHWLLDSQKTKEKAPLKAKFMENLSKRDWPE